MTSSMRILHISETDYEGGAGRAAHTLHTALRRQGIESFFLTECARTDEPWTFTFSGHRGMVAKGLRHLRATLDLLPLRRYPRRQTGAWSIGWLPRRLPPLVRRLRPDIIHLHWISQALPVQAVGSLPGPIVWTHHDWGASRFLSFKVGRSPACPSSTTAPRVSARPASLPARSAEAAARAKGRKPVDGA